MRGFFINRCPGKLEAGLECRTSCAATASGSSGLELKVRGSKLSPEQEREAQRLRNSGGVFVVVRVELGDLTEALAALEALEGS